MNASAPVGAEVVQDHAFWWPNARSEPNRSFSLYQATEDQRWQAERPAGKRHMRIEAISSSRSASPAIAAANSLPAHPGHREPVSGKALSVVDVVPDAAEVGRPVDGDPDIAAPDVVDPSRGETREDGSDPAMHRAPSRADCGARVVCPATKQQPVVIGHPVVVERHPAVRHRDVLG